GYWEYVYDLNGNLIEQTDAKGQSISFAYDELNRLLSKTDGGDISVAYTYDDLANGFAKGKLTRVDYQGGSAEFEYDELGREIQSTKSIGGKDYVVERQYDDLNNLKEIIYPDGSKVFYKYNNIGQIESVSNEEKSFDQHTRLINETQNERKNVWEQIVHFYTDWFEPNVLGIREAQAMEILFAPAAPTIESAEARNKEVELTWRCSRVNFNVSYTIKYGTIRGYYDTVVKINDIGKRSYIVDGLTNGVKYYFVMTAINPAGESRNSNRVTAIPQFPQNQAPNVDAGLDIEITLPDNVNLYGVVSDDELPEPPAKTNVQWSHVSGAGVVTFADRAISNTTATFSEAGTYVLRLTANDGELNSSDELTIIVNSELQKNQVPILNAIGDKIVNENEMLSFAIIANDLDGDVVTYKAMNLPAGAIFDTSTQEIDWMPTFDQSGEYAGVLFEVTDGKDIAFEEIVITVENVNRAPEKLTAKAISTSRIDLTWELSIDVPVVAAYRVYRDGVIVAETNELNYSDIGLRVETQYVYNITAIDAAQNESLLSGDVIVLTLGTPEIDDTLIVVDVDYNVMGQAVKIMYGSGTVENYEYDDLSFRLIRKYTDSSAGEILQDLNYKYDAVGNIVSIIDNVNTATQSFKYDEINRLIEARGESYESKDFVYDEIGNIIEKDGKSYYYGEGGAGPHAVTLLSDGATFTYDENGNMQSRQLGAGGDLTIYSYDSENRLIEVEKNSSLLASYAYDGDGGRTRQATDNGQKTIVYVGSLYEKNGNENYGTNTVFLGSQRVAAVTNGLTYYYHADHLGGTNILTDSAGEKKEKIEYLPFGEINEYAYEKFGSDEEVAKLYFTGKRKDDETGLYYYGARYYDPEWGRFITADSLVQDPVNPITLNRYSYCGNNPIVRVDPTGHFWMELLGFLVMGSQVYNDYQFASGQISAGQWGANLGVSVMTAGTLSVPAGPVSSVGYGWRLMQASGVMSIGSQIAGQTGLSDLQSGLAAGAKYAGMAYTGLNVLKGMKDWAVGKLDVRDMAINPSTIQSGDNAFVNGIDTDLNGAFNKALLLNKNKSLAINKVVHNATSGFIADMTEVALQKLTFTSSVDRQLANMLKVLNNVTLIGHSQGSVIVGNTLLNLGFRDARNAVVDAKFLSTPLSQPRASISAAIGGTRGVFEYFNEYGDPINIIGPNINPAKFVSGFTFQFNKH
ncbi:MAG: hypothetical protein KKD07_03070, partial [Candidatus Omnitrophica bacterium]|nr:hypothetical protein [Candidatus Omnitrophota bacterium]